MAGVIRRGQPRTAERLGDGVRRGLHLVGRDLGRQRPSAPVVGHLPRLAAEFVQEVTHPIGVGGHALQVGERARRGLSGVEHADHRDDFGPVEAGVQAGLVEAPVPVVRRCGEEQHEEVAPGEDTADLAPPVHARGDVDAGYEAFDEPGAKALHRLLHLDRE